MIPVGVSDNKWITFGLVAVGIFMSTLDGSIVNIALPVIMKDLTTAYGLYLNGMRFLLVIMF